MKPKQHTPETWGVLELIADRGGRCRIRDLRGDYYQAFMSISEPFAIVSTFYGILARMRIRGLIRTTQISGAPNHKTVQLTAKGKRELRFCREHFE